MGVEGRGEREREGRSPLGLVRSKVCDALSGGKGGKREKEGGRQAGREGGMGGGGKKGWQGVRDGEREGEGGERQ